MAISTAGYCLPNKVHIKRLKGMTYLLCIMYYTVAER